MINKIYPGVVPLIEVNNGRIYQLANLLEAKLKSENIQLLQDAKIIEDLISNENKPPGVYQNCLLECEQSSATSNPPNEWQVYLRIPQDAGRKYMITWDEAQTLLSLN